MLPGSPSEQCRVHPKHFAAQSGCSVQKVETVKHTPVFSSASLPKIINLVILRQFFLARGSLI